MSAEPELGPEAREAARVRKDNSRLINFLCGQNILYNIPNNKELQPRRRTALGVEHVII